MTLSTLRAGVNPKIETVKVRTLCSERSCNGKTEKWKVSASVSGDGSGADEVLRQRQGIGAGTGGRPDGTVPVAGSVGAAGPGGRGGRGGGAGNAARAGRQGNH